MTLPYERTRAVLAAREFLLRLASPHNDGIKGVRQDVRAEARRLLRHYPTWLDMGREECFGVAEEPVRE